jgi:predicted phage tail protein
VCRTFERRLQQAAAAVLKLRSNVLILQRDMEEAQQQLHRNGEHITALQADLAAEQSACAGAVPFIRRSTRLHVS